MDTWYEKSGVPVTDANTIFGLLMNEHPHASRRIETVSAQKIGTGYLVWYRVLNAFPGQQLPHEDRTAFVHVGNVNEAGILWDKSCRWIG